MFGSSVLEIAIGLAGVYAMMSLVCTAANELISSVTTWRAKNLAHGIRNLLDESGAERPNPAAAVAAALGLASKTKVSPGASLAQQFYDHPLIQGLYRKGQQPSYIPSRTFALALMDLIVPAGPQRPRTIEGIRQAVDASPLAPGLKRVLSVLIDDAGNTMAAGQQLLNAGVIDTQKLETALNHVHENVEVWFNNAMERVAGWYKRKTQAVIFALALIFTCALNVDTMLIIERLSYDTALRQALVSQAETLVRAPDQSAGAGAVLETNITRLEGTGLPLGWGAERAPRQHRDAIWYLTKIFGLLLTAGAASLGAPFWFDVLNKIITIRSAGKAPEESPKSPKEIPRPLAPGQAIPPVAAAPPADGSSDAPART
jgi:hypothetical protein